MSLISLVTYIDSKGQRVTTETAYLTPEVLARPNLTIVTHAQVMKVVIDVNSETGIKRAVGVEFVFTKGGTRTFVRAKNEVILS